MIPRSSSSRSEVRSVCSNHPFVIGALLAGIACTTIGPTSGSAAGPQRGEASHAVTGEWRLEFRLDSVMSREGGNAHWLPGSFRTTTGRLTLRDSVAGRSNLFHSQIDISFDSLLGRPMSCFDPRPTATAVERSADTVRVRFTPRAFDCGFGASGVLRGDSVVGTWDETSFAGPVAMGRLRMTRAN